jgi:hypothetical protein
MACNEAALLFYFTDLNTCNISSPLRVRGRLKTYIADAGHFQKPLVYTSDECFLEFYEQGTVKGQHVPRVYFPAEAPGFETKLTARSAK